jgi:hypothetical protein
VCVVTNTGGGAPGVALHAQCFPGCAAGLFNSQCVTMPGYSCGGTYSLTSGTSFRCSSQTSPCGQGQGGCS